MTNSDKIRLMTDEELYNFISKIDIYRCYCPAVKCAIQTMIQTM